ncbi:MAG: hypothetical protein JWN46_2404 [Acidimicrobiales bacterium]|nr:hypothetical protein [Acidimicrobiales bacterium]
MTDVSARARWPRSPSWLALLAVPLLALGLTGCAPDGPTVLVLGDSITAEVHASPEASYWLAQTTTHVDWAGTLFMSSPCNGLQAVRQLKYVPDVVIINYAGNHGSFTQNCMNGETGKALVDRYLADIGAIGRLLKNGHTRISLVGAPARQERHVNSEDVYNAMAGFAHDHHLTFIDGGAYITPGRVMSRTGPCLRRETGQYCGAAGPGRNYIRDEALVHLCPGPIDVYGRCDYYSSGAVRLAIQFQAAIDQAVKPRP